MSASATLRKAAIRAGFEMLAASGMARLATPVFGGVGLVLTLHRVLRPHGGAFQPNRHLEISPDFLRALLKHLRSAGLDIVSLDEAARRLREREFDRRFVCLTFDDGHLDLRDVALPILREFEAPFAAYVTVDFAARISAPWWIVAEDILARHAWIGPVEGVLDEPIRCADPASKAAAFARIAAGLQRLGDPARLRKAVEELAADDDFPVAATADKVCLSWDELRQMASDPLLTLGAHGISHCNLSAASDGEAWREVTASRTITETALGLPVRHFAYPYGDVSSVGAREHGLAAGAGFSTATTTRPDVLSADSWGSPMALPRISVNGTYQSERFLAVLTSGLATAAWNGLRRAAPPRGDGSRR